MSPPLHYTSALLPNLNDTNGDSMSGVRFEGNT